jgi:thiamine-monophosphate kinase
MDEFDLIRQYFAPLSQGFDGSLGLTDDAAILPYIPGHDLIVTKDALSEGVHFFGTEPAYQIAQKTLRVNLSDLAAMGAKPLAYFLGIMLPRETEQAWVAEFARGLAEDQQAFGIYLAGGDTISTRGPLSFSITAIGSVPQGRSLKRSHAQPGDLIFVTGTLGDSALGLRLLNGSIETLLPDDARHWLENRYFLPQPRLELGSRLIGHANACMDISDGLMQDLTHICNASEVGAILEKQKLPVSAAAQQLLQQDDTLWRHVLTGGDDYELLFTAPASQHVAIAALAAELQVPLSVIGAIEEGQGAIVRDEQGNAITFSKPGFNHFI